MTGSPRAALIAIGLSLLSFGPAAAQQPPIDPYRLELGQPTGVRPDARALAAAQARIMDLEDELRRLRGRLEESDHRQRQMENRLDGLERRLQTAPAGDDATPAPAPSRPRASSEDGTGTSGQTSPEGSVQGSIPRDAVLGLPRPTDGATPAAAPAEGGDPGTRYRAALTLLQEGNYAAAAAAFQRYLDAFPDDANSPAASFWLGETLYFRERYADAAAVYARNYRTYGENGLKAPENLLKLGMSLSAMGDQDRACQTFDELGRRYPGAEGAVARNLERAKRSAGCA